MLFRCRFYADGPVIASICIHEHRERGDSLTKKKVYCQRVVSQHFQAYGECLVSTEMPNWQQLEDLTDEEREFGEWCEKRRW
jgi:hypothetical protein